MRIKFVHFMGGAILGSSCGVWSRVLGGLILNHVFGLSELSYFLFGSLIIPKLWLFTFFSYIIIGTPIFLMARYKEKLSLMIFCIPGVVFGYFASFPSLLSLSWGMMYALSGFVTGFVGYFSMLYFASGMFKDLQSKLYEFATHRIKS